MFSIKDIKADAKICVKRNFWPGVIVCFILAVFFGEYIFSSYAITSYSDYAADYMSSGSETLTKYRKMTNSDYIRILFSNDDVIEVYESYGIKPPYGTDDIKSAKLSKEQKKEMDNKICSLLPNKIFIDKIISFSSDIISLQNTYPVQIAAGTKGLFNRHTFTLGVVILVISILSMLFSFFVGLPLKVGRSRFFMENLYYKDTGATRILFLYRQGYIIKPCIIMTIFSAMLFVSGLTVIFYFPIYYMYKQVPYILAENPTVGIKQAFKLSRQMMKGYKWRAFLLDLSFAGWHILSILSLGAVGIFYTNSYTSAANAKLYLIVRKNAIKNQYENCDKLCDRYIDLSDVDDEQKIVIFKENESARNEQIEKKKRRQEQKEIADKENELERIRRIQEMSYDIKKLPETIKEIPKNIKELSKTIKDDSEERNRVKELKKSQMENDKIKNDTDDSGENNIEL